MPTVDSMLVTGNQTIEQDLQVNGNQTIDQELQLNGNVTIDQDLQVNGNVTIDQDLQVNGSQTVDGHLQVNGSELIVSNLSVGGEIGSGGSVKATFRLTATNQPSLPVIAASPQQINYYNPGVVNQPGLLLVGTDGNNYVLFVDASGISPTLAIQKA